MWPLALQVFDEGLWWDTIPPASASPPRACDPATLNAAMEVLPPLQQEEDKGSESDTTLLRLFGPGLYRRGMAAGLSKGWQKKTGRKGIDNGRALPAGGPRRIIFTIDLHEHSVRMALHGALPDALLALQQSREFPRDVHIVTGHGTGRGRYRGLAPHLKQPPTAEGVGVLYPRVRRWLERHLPKGTVYEVSLGCVGVEAEALKRALPALLASVS
jgi:hypothetical protein